MTAKGIVRAIRAMLWRRYGTTDAATKGNVLVTHGSAPNVEAGWLAASGATDGHVLTLDSSVDAGIKWAAAPGAGGGDSVQVNGVAVTDVNLRDGTPAAPANALNVAWQRSGSGPDSVSAYVLTDGTTIEPSGSSIRVKDGSITAAKLANINSQRVIGRNTVGAGVTEAVTAEQILDWIGSTRGSILYRGAAAWVILTPGTAGHALVSSGPGADPAYAAPAPAAHATSHKSGGSDAIRLDELATPTASVAFNDQQATSFRIENRTSDPGSPTEGQIWLRTDL